MSGRLLLMKLALVATTLGFGATSLALLRAPRGASLPGPEVSFEEQAARFRKYFKILDAARGPVDDATLTSTFTKQLGELRPEFTALKAATIAPAHCGNGLCRVDVSFSDASLCDRIRTELMFHIGPTAAQSTVQIHEPRTAFSAYFAMRGTRLPPFPTDSR